MPSKRRKIQTEENQNPLFFDSLKVFDLPVNSSLPAVKAEIKKKSSGKVMIRVFVPGENKLINIYFILNGKKKDMYYQVSPGEYFFEFLLKEHNFFEMFYTYGSVRSETAFSFI